MVIIILRQFPEIIITCDVILACAHFAYVEICFIILQRGFKEHISKFIIMHVCCCAEHFSTPLHLPTEPILRQQCRAAVVLLINLLRRLTLH